MALPGVEDLHLIRKVEAYLESSGEVEADEICAERNPYPFDQLMAPYDGKMVPNSGALREVRCHDISAIGFSYLSPSPPDYDSIVVILGNSRTFICASAHVTAYHEGYWDRHRQYLVDAKFADKLG